MTEQSPQDLQPDASAERPAFYTPPALPKGGGTVSVGGGMLSSAGPDGAAGWHLPLPSPSGRALSASLALNYSSAGGNSAFGAGWEYALPAVACTTRFGFPRYDGHDRLVGPSGGELLRAAEPRRATRLPFSATPAGYVVTPWTERVGGLDSRLEHWQAEEDPDGPGFWLQYLADGSLSLYGWSDSARLFAPGEPRHTACWYLEEQVSARGEHVVYRYRLEDEQGCSQQELEAHPRVVNIYPQAVYAMNATPSEGLLIPAQAFDEDDFLTFTVFDYGERGADPEQVPLFEPAQCWPVRDDCHSFWRYGFNVRLRRLCRDVLLWHRTARLDGQADPTPELVARLHLEYDSSPVASILVSAAQLSADVDLRLPPLEFELSRPGRAVPQWEALPELDGFWADAWQLADLHGDGVPGLLYLDEHAWHYRAPQRGDGEDRITWGPPEPLPQVPTIGRADLMDLDGDGRPEWVVTAGGLQGSFTLGTDGAWSGLVPIAALPSEYDHPQMRLADLTGDGQSDVVMLRALGPRSVRLYPSAGNRGWLAARSEQYHGRVPLPSLGQSLVVFADPAGSGQAHLVRITGQGVTLWPSLGYGRFDEALQIPGFEVADFNPSRVFLADTDGAGTTDILYLQPDGIRVFVSQCGNRFVEGPFIKAPDGLVLDDTCQVQVADVRGQGTADLLLTVPLHGADNAPRSWLYRFNERRPWLLHTIVDNLGSRTELDYRSSAQAWLDEKAAVTHRTGRAPVSHLPFPVHTLSRVTAVNEITGVTLGSEMRYLGGVWDSTEREFAGFRRLLQTDTHALVDASATHLSPPTRVLSWFHCGIETLDGLAEEAFTDMDAAFPQGEVRLTQGAGHDEHPFSPEPALRTWLYRALRGQLLRREVYGLDGQAQADKPYSVERPRWQIRACATADDLHPSALITAVQHLGLNCERYPQDPQVDQAIVLRQDRYGNVLESVTVKYPRLLDPAALAQEEVERKIYPASLPSGLIEASCDEQQYDCWVSLSRATVHNRVKDDDFVIGLPGAMRRDMVHFAQAQVPEGGFSVEYLLEQGLPLSDPARTVLASYEKTVWRQADGSGASSEPSRQALRAYTRTAMLDKASLDVLRPAFELTLLGLLQDALANPSSDPAVLGRLRRRLPVVEHAVTYGLLLSYLEQAPDDREASQMLRQALKHVISVQALRDRLLDEAAEALPEGLHGALRKESRVPDAALGSVLAWFGAQHAQDAAVLATLHAALVSALSANSADALFCRALLAALQRVPSSPARTAAEQAWLLAVRQELDRPLQEETLPELLKRGGYIAMDRPLDAEELADAADPDGLGVPGIAGEPLVEQAYCGHHGISHYQDALHFWQPHRMQDSTVTGPSQLSYSAHDVVVVKVCDAAGLTSTIEAYDWRFLQPVRIQDANDNLSEVALDALGRVLHTRFYGTQTAAGSDEAVMTGYCSGRPFTPPPTVADAVALNDSKGVPVHTAFTVVADSWMPLALTSDGSTDPARRCGALAWRRMAARLSVNGLGPFAMVGRTPPHTVQILSDRYDYDPEQQVRVTVTLTGGGQLLQSAVLNPPGEAFVRTEQGALLADAQGGAVSRDATVRWAVSGKTEYDNKGQAVRVWLPFYLDDWRWVSDDSAREGIYADTHYYDALGREYRVVRAAGEEVEGQWANYERRVQQYPWFTVSEDENDTWLEVIEQARLRARSTVQ